MHHAHPGQQRDSNDVHVKRVSEMHIAARHLVYLKAHGAIMCAHAQEGAAAKALLSGGRCCCMLQGVEGALEA